MAIFKCKMCGGELEIKPGSTIAECTYCGAKQTLPKLDDDKRFNLYDRANHFRRNNEFDKAMGIYENILNEDKTDAEAYWSLVLCRYGIEYVKDPASHKMVPTVNRAQFTSIYDDEDYKAALKYADSLQRQVYEAEAASINEIQKGILEISQKEEPFDVFICYKETDQNGRRTQDSVLANELYHELINEGFKVFFARITLEDKLGTAYEPYIFAALNSAKVMVVLGTKAEFFNAVWVKNEWSRYLSLIKSGAKKTLIPAYRDMDPYDLPKEFSHLQAQDMSKLGFMPDLVRGIRKLAQPETKPTAAPTQTVVVQSEGGVNTIALLKRGNMALEDGEWNKATEFFEQVLNMDAECGSAYLGQFLAVQKCKTTDEYAQKRINATAEAKTENLTACSEDESRIRACIDQNKVEGYLAAEEIRNLFPVMRTYSSTEACRKQQLEEENRNLNNQKFLIRAIQFGAQSEVDMMQEKILSVMRERLSDSQKKAIQNKESAIADYKQFLEATEKKTAQMHKEAINKEENDRAGKYKQACELKSEAKSSAQMRYAAEQFDDLGDYRDSRAVADECRQLTAQLEGTEKIQAEGSKKKKRTITITTCAAIAVCVAVYIVLTSVIIPNNKYNAAIALMDAGEYEEAIEAFETLSGYKDSAEQFANCYIGKYGEDSWNTYKSLEIGDTYIFGTYEQDNNQSNGSEDIEWIILDKTIDENGLSLLVISEYALDCQPYNSTYESVTWESCTLRAWLNDEFLRSAFSSDEQSMIPEVTVTADDNPEYSTDPGKNTEDRIFLLSMNEAEEYFTLDDARICVPTDYAIAQGAYTSDSDTLGGKVTCWWWLRSPGVNQNNTACVTYDGSVYFFGIPSDIDTGCIRPALWINLDS